MHLNYVSVWSGSVSHSIPNIALLSWCFMGVPLPLHKPFVVAGIDDGRFALSEGNKTSISIHVSSLAGRFCLADEPACLFEIKLNPA